MSIITHTKVDVNTFRYPTLGRMGFTARPQASTEANYVALGIHPKSMHSFWKTKVLDSNFLAKTKFQVCCCPVPHPRFVKLTLVSDGVVGVIGRIVWMETKTVWAGIPKIKDSSEACHAAPFKIKMTYVYMVLYSDVVDSFMCAATFGILGCSVATTGATVAEKHENW